MELVLGAAFEKNHGGDVQKTSGYQSKQYIDKFAPYDVLMEHQFRGEHSQRRSQSENYQQPKRLQLTQARQQNCDQSERLRNFVKNDAYQQGFAAMVVSGQRGLFGK